MISIPYGFSELSPAQEEPPRPPQEAGVSQQTADLLAPDGGGAGSTFSSGPSYNSGWLLVAPDQSLILTANFGGSTDDYVVAMDDWTEGLDGIN